MINQEKLQLGVLVYWCCLSALLVGCATAQNPITRQSEPILIQDQEEVNIGRSVAQQIAQQMKFINDPKWQTYMQRTGYAIAKVSDRPKLPYHFHIVDDPNLNAFSIPGGGVYVHMGLIEITNDDELACVLAHEIGHIATRHSIKHIQTEMGYRFLVDLASAFGRVGQNARQISTVAFQLIQRGFSREDELEADILAIRYSYWAGYNPRALVTVLKKMKEEESREPSALEQFLSTHPSLSERIVHAREELRSLGRGE